ncbi:MAG TPA: hypothetical protein VEX68_21430 [Bryobacteraceae bacterium]|nr:hypothetical protein [Bryobacteraceae bacterium]
MKHLLLIPTMLISAASATETRISKSSEARVPESVVDGAANFYRSDKVTAQKVTFRNQYEMKVAGNIFIPKASNQNGNGPPSWSATRWVQ